MTPGEKAAVYSPVSGLKTLLPNVGRSPSPLELLISESEMGIGVESIIILIICLPSSPNSLGYEGNSYPSALNAFSYSTSDPSPSRYALRRACTSEGSPLVASAASVRVLFSEATSSNSFS